MIKVLSVKDFPWNKEVRFINLNGESKGIISFKEAFDESEANKVQLALMAEGDIPVVKSINVGKMLFEQKKNQKKNKATIQKVKEIKFGLNVGEHDLDIKIKHIREFIEDNCKVKVTLQLFGRELQREEYAMDFYKSVMEKLFEFAKTEETPKLIGRTISIYFVRK